MIKEESIGFTGTRDGMTINQRTVFSNLIEELQPIRFRHGDCIGADAEAHYIISKTECYIHIHPPEICKFRAFCQKGVVHDEKEYIERNHDIVDASNTLIACPKEMTEPKQKKGGDTWATIRYARKQRDTKTIVILPDGTIIN